MGTFVSFVYLLRLFRHVLRHVRYFALYCISHTYTASHEFNSGRTRVKFAAIYNLHIEYGWKISAKFCRMVPNKRDCSLEADRLTAFLRVRIRNARLRINRSYRVRGRSTSVFNTSAPLVLIERARTVFVNAATTFSSIEKNFELRNKLLYFIIATFLSQFQRTYYDVSKHQPSWDKL